MASESREISMAVPTAGLVAVGGFIVAILSGMFVENPFSAVLARALLVMLVLWPIGLVVGFVLERLFREHVSNQATQMVQADLSTDEEPEDPRIVDQSSGELDSPVVEVPVASSSEVP